jgi:hypothetical protein
MQGSEHGEALLGAAISVDYLASHGQLCRMKKMAVIGIALALAGGWTQCFAQDDSAPPPTPDVSLRSSAELDQLLGPIALYPDPLIGLILPAAGVPSQIVLADRYVSQGGDPNQISVQPWDPSVQGLAHYPTVLKWMDDNLDWTTELGVAFTSQQSDVMDSIQRLRSQAQALGNLQSTPQENVESDDGDIDIDPVDPNEIYVPDYQPDQIYYQPGVYCTFGVGFPIGVWLGFDWDWHHHHLIAWRPDHPRPQGWWQRSSGNRRKEITTQNTTMWRPKSRPASIIVRGAGDRGYESGADSHLYVPPRASAPREREVPRPTQAPRVSVTEIGRPQEASRPIERDVRPVERSEPSESAFGGSQSSREVRESSSRGEESRSISTGSARSSGGSSGRR